jgi:1-acyl-sn-glycerol-3-phosphate acyltransferase
MRDALWTVVNVVQTLLVGLWTAGLVAAALLVAALTFRRGPGLALARRVWAPGVLAACGARLEVTGRDRVDFSRPHMFAANHQSWLDIPALFVALPTHLLFVGKRELRHFPFLGWYMAAMGMVFVDREDRKESAKVVGRSAQRLREGWSLLTFPEGTRSLDGRPRRFKTAFFAAPLDAQAPVVPVGITGAERVLPKGGIRVRPGTIRVAVGEPILTQGMTRADRASLAKRTQEAVEGLL